MLLRNDLLEYLEKDGKVIRILWLHPEKSMAATFEVNVHGAEPELVQIDLLLDDIKTGKAKLLPADPHLIVVNEESISDKSKKIRIKAWSLIEPLVSDEPAIYFANRRWKLITQCIQQYGSTHRTIYRYLHRYWQRGQTPNALLPDYANSGGRDKKRSPNNIKRGRPRKFGDFAGINVSEDTRKIFRVAVTRYYVMQVKFTLRGSYDQMIKDFFCERTIDPETGSVTHSQKVDMTTTGFPTFGQFNYWIGQDNNRLDIKRKRLKPRIYDKDLRGLLGTATAEVWGPGARYEIDATIADVYLVSRINRQKIIGRPVLYIVIDVFSRMITGIYIGLEGPSWVGAMMALANTASDKQAFCKKFGHSIEPEEWPCHHLPASLLGDRGEIESRMIETLINNFNITVETAAAYRGDWKGIVEQRFKLLPAKFKPHVPGYIDVDYRARGGKDYRLDAVLDLDQFTQIIIQCVLYYNNQHELKRYDKDRDLAADNVPAVPIDLWEWGIANRSGSLRQYPEDLVRFSLLPVEEATVTVNGVRFQGVFYTCQKTIEERWFDRARQNGTWKVKISYDPRNMDEIYLHDNHVSMQYQTCTMTERSRSHRQMSLWEIEQQQKAEQQVSAKRQPRQQLASADLSAGIETIVVDALKQKNKPSTESAASRTKNIKTNRANEKHSNRTAETFRFNADKSSPTKSADILPFHGAVTDDYSEPDIMEIMGSKGDDDAKR